MKINTNENENYQFLFLTWHPAGGGHVERKMKKHREVEERITDAPERRSGDRFRDHSGPGSDAP